MDNGHVRDYAYKSDILKNKKYLLDKQKLVSKSLYRHDDVFNYKTGEIITLHDACQIERDLFEDSDWIECKRINQSSYQRSNKLKKRITKMLALGDCVFLTLTFKDDVFKSTDALTRKRYVTRYCKSQSNEYIANIDFGVKNGREHYHAIILGKIDFEPWWSSYGGINGEIIHSNNVSPIKLGKYISKLTNHAIKETTKRNAIIYSRKQV